MPNDTDRSLSFTVTISDEITQAPLEAAVSDILMSFEDAQQRAWQEVVKRQPAWAEHQIMPRSPMPVRGLRATAPFHWAGIPGAPFGPAFCNTKISLFSEFTFS